MKPAHTTKPHTPHWLADARAHATDYLHRFAFNPGVAKVVALYDSHFAYIKDPDQRLDYLKKLAAEHWDFRKGRERYEITETYEIDNPGSDFGKRVFEGAAQAEMGVSSKASLKHYDIMAVLGGANMGPYVRLKYGLEQKITYDMLAYLGSERELPPAECETVKRYAPGARTEFDLGKGAIHALIGKELSGRGEYELFTAEWHVVHLQRKDGLPIVLLSAPPLLGGRRANTADTYDFMRRLEQEAFTPPKNILFTTGALYRYAQYFDAMREIHLRTGVDVEIIGFEPAYSGIRFMPTQFLQELKAASDAAVRLRDAAKGEARIHDWRTEYYNRFERDESMRPDVKKVNQPLLLAERAMIQAHGSSLYNVK